MPHKAHGKMPQKKIAVVECIVTQPYDVGKAVIVNLHVHSATSGQIAQQHTYKSVHFVKQAVVQHAGSFFRMFR